MNRLVMLLQSPDINVCRNAAFTIATAAHNEHNAIMACQVGAVDALVQLSKETAKRSKKFATEALEKILNYSMNQS